MEFLHLKFLLCIIGIWINGVVTRTGEQCLIIGKNCTHDHNL